MKMRVRTFFCCLAIGLFLVSCATKEPMPPAPELETADLSQLVKSGKYAPKAESYLIILDASQSMRDPYKYEGYTKFGFAKELVGNIIASVPDMGLQGGLRTFGHGACLPNAPTLAINELQRHDKAALKAGLEKVECDGGPSPLAQAFDEAGEDLSDLKTSGKPGSTAVIVISDGLGMGMKAVQAAERLNSRIEGLCYYSVHVGQKTEGRAFMKRLAGVSDCAPAIDGSELASAKGMSDFLEMALLQEAVDTDGDGVFDHVDQCPGTMRGTPVDSVGCPRDRDRDGVADSKDRCPNTPRGIGVDSWGCPFDSDKDGVPDDKDKCPNTPKGAVVDWNGCPVDSDGDGVYDHKDACPKTPRGVPVDKFGCPLDK